MVVSFRGWGSKVLAGEADGDAVDAAGHDFPVSRIGAHRLLVRVD